ncbi:MAG: 2-oxo acid dehydrogenase subunit E2 [Chloroflexaceae bacterium]|nr:2-oxo acid dehydrogenase subunit E2 [Chloroflexaceae bacterium]
MAEVTMPRLSDTMEEGKIGRWLKQPGDYVEKGEIIVEIETDKATMELESYESGTLQKIVVQPGQTVPIGEIIAFIGKGAADESAAAPAPASPEPAPAATEAQPSTPTNGNAVDEHIKASPVARRLAEEYRIDLSQVQGTGPGGRIIKENVEAFFHNIGGTPSVSTPPASTPAAPTTSPAAAASTPAAPSTPVAAPAAQAAAPAPPAPAVTPGSLVPMSRMRRAIARAMTEAKAGIPHVYVTSEIDMSAALQLRQQINEQNAASVRISVNDLVVKAAAKALLAFPALNNRYGTDSDGQPGIVQQTQININVAVALDEGLVAPVVVDADKKSLGTIASEIRDMAGRAREGKIKQSDLEGGTLTVSNLGMFDVAAFSAVITPPQAAVLAVGSVRSVPVVRNNEIVIGQVMQVTLSSDHRVTDGAVSAQYLQEFKRLLQSPMSLLV